MRSYPPQSTPVHNPLTHRQHKKEMWTQVTLPIVIGSVIFVAACVLTWWWGWGGTGGDVSRWASISLIWLIVPTMLVGLIALLILVGSTYSIIRLIMLLPRYSYQALGWILLVGVYIRRLNDWLVEPILRKEMISASMKAFGRRK